MLRKAFLITSKWTLILSLALPHHFVYAEAITAILPPAPELKLSPAMVLRAQAIRNSREFYLARISPRLEKLRRNVAPAAGFMNEAVQFQALIITLAAAQIQASNERDEIERLAGGRSLEDKVTPGDDRTCAPNSDAVITSALCSGEFQLGLLAGSAAIGLNMGVKALLSGLLQSAATKLPILRIIGAFSSAMLVMTVGQAATFLWAQAVKELKDSAEIVQAHGVAGRALIAFSSGNFKAFNQSTDGEIFRKIFKNMYEIAWVDDKLRDVAVYNLWRFGVLRGEVFSALGVLAAAPVVGSLSATAITTIAAGFGVAAVSRILAPIVAFIVTFAVGLGAMTILVSHDVPESLTAHFQNMRQFVDDNHLRAARIDLQMSLLKFQSEKFPLAGTERYVNYFLPKVRYNIVNLIHQRDDLVNVLIEKLYEHMVERKRFETKIDIAEKTVREANLLPLLYVQFEGQIMSFPESQEKSCAASTGGCHPSVDYQIQALEKLRPLVKQAQLDETWLAQLIVYQYAQDQKYLADMFASTKFIFPVPIALALASFKNQSAAMRDMFKIELGALNEGTAAKFNVGYSTEMDPQTHLSEKDKLIKLANEDLSIFYTHCFYEDDAFAALEKADAFLPADAKLQF